MIYSRDASGWMSYWSSEQQAALLLQRLQLDRSARLQIFCLSSIHDSHHEGPLTASSTQVFWLRQGPRLTELSWTSMLMFFIIVFVKRPHPDRGRGAWMKHDCLLRLEVQMQSRGLVDSMNEDMASIQVLWDTPTEPPWAKKIVSHRFKSNTPRPSRQSLSCCVLYQSSLGIESSETHSYNSANTADVSTTHPGCQVVRWRLDGVTSLQPVSECWQVFFHPALVQSDGFQSFLHTPHLWAAFL